MPDLRPRRSILTVPGSKERFLVKAATTAADVVILDLEDSVTPDRRQEARANVITALKDIDWGAKFRTVRVNAISTHYFYQDVVKVVEGAGDQIDAIVLPKAESASDVYMLDRLLGQIEVECHIAHRIGIEVLIETAPAMRDVALIAQASPRVTSLIFGPGDFAAAMGMPVLSIGEHADGALDTIWQIYLSRILVAARSVGARAIDGPYARLDDPVGLQHSAQRSRTLGYDGKWVIHPSQIDLVNTIWSPAPEEIARAQAIVHASQSAIQEGRGAYRVGGEMQDAASVAMAQRLLQRVVGGEPVAE